MVVAAIKCGCVAGSMYVARLNFRPKLRTSSRGTDNNVRLASGVAVLLAVIAAHAGATSLPCGTPIAGTAGERDGAAIIRLAAGGHLIAWRDNRGLDGGQTYISLVDSLSQVAAAWPIEGLLLSTPGRLSMAPHVASLGPSSAIIAWSVNVGPENGRETYCAIVGPAELGGLMPSDVNVDTVTNRPGGQTPVAIVAQGAGRALIIMQDLSSRQQALVKQVAGRGDQGGLWPPGGVVLADDQGIYPFGLAAVTACTDDSSGCLVMTAGTVPIDMFHYDITYRLFRLLPDGTRDPRWPIHGIVITTRGDEFNLENALLPDGEGGAYFAWTTGSRDPANQVRVMVQRVDRSGEFHAGWNPAGVVAVPSRASSYQWFPRLVGGGPERIAVLLEENEGLRLKAISGDGSTFPFWPDTGLVIGQVTEWRALGSARLLGGDASALAALWSESPTGPTGPQAVYATAIDWDGRLAAAWPAVGRALCPIARHQLLQSLDSGPENRFAVAWVHGASELRFGQFSIADGALAVGAEARHVGYSIKRGLIESRWAGVVPDGLCAFGLRRVDSGEWMARDSIQQVGPNEFVLADLWPAGATTVEYRLGAPLETGLQGFSDTLRLVSGREAPGLRLSMDGVQSGRSLWMFVQVGMPGEELRIEAYDVTGRLVATRSVGSLPVGTHSIELPLPRPRQGIVFVRAKGRFSTSVARTALLN